MAPNLATLARLVQLEAGTVWRSDLDRATERHDAGAWLLLAMALCGASRWTVDMHAAAHAAHVHPKSIRRSVAKLCAEHLWCRGDDGSFTRGEALGEPSGQWLAVGPALCRTLATLAASGPDLTALRLGLALLPRIRAARARRAASCSFTNDRLGRELHMGRASATAAFRRLEGLGLRSVQSRRLLLTEEGPRYQPRELPTDSAPWSHEAPDTATESRDTPAEGAGQAGTARCRDRQEQEPQHGIAHATPAAPVRPAGLERGEAVPVSPVAAPKPPPPPEALAVLHEAGLRGKGLEVVARALRDGRSAAAWVAGEAPMLGMARNPGGWLWCAWRDYDSRPGSPSRPSQRRRAEVDALGRLEDYHRAAGYRAPWPEVPDGLRDWTEAASAAARVVELRRPFGVLGAVERRALRDALGYLVGELRAAPDLLPRGAEEQLAAWEELARDQDGDELHPDCDDARALVVEAFEAEPVEAFEAEPVEAFEAEPVEAFELSPPAPKLRGRGRHREPAPSVVTGAAVGIGSQGATLADLKGWGGGNAAAGLRVWLEARKRGAHTGAGGAR